MINPKLTINCRGTLLDLTGPVVMAILNINDDSFFPGSRFTDPQLIVEQAGRMLMDGAQILDVGGMSSRPGAPVIEEQVELDRVLPVVELLQQMYPKAIISVDTVRAKVAEKAIEAGASIINDISAGRIDPEMYATVAALQVPYVLMHMQKRPENMQEAPAYEHVVQDVLDFMIREIAILRELGLKDIIVDPGFGFGKSIEHNYDILRSLHVFQMLETPVLAGLSRKSMIYKPLNIKPETALNGTSVLHLAALQQGARILRVHDVAPAMEVIKLFELL
ncbi:MAG: dihydropteroate synthase [Saprospiraceae bacterium]|nr:dihydropteroate synthase [Lewinella sp.]